MRLIVLFLGVVTDILLVWRRRFLIISLFESGNKPILWQVFGPGKRAAIVCFVSRRNARGEYLTLFIDNHLIIQPPFIGIHLCCFPPEIPLLYFVSILVHTTTYPYYWYYTSKCSHCLVSYSKIKLIINMRSLLLRQSQYSLSVSSNQVVSLNQPVGQIAAISTDNTRLWSTSLWERSKSSRKATYHVLVRRTGKTPSSSYRAARLKYCFHSLPSLSLIVLYT